MTPADDDAIRAAIARARRLTEDQPEPFRSLAFRGVLDHLLRGGMATASGPGVTAPAVDMDLTEFLASRKAATHPDRVVAVAYYVYRTQGGAGVTTHDLTDAYSRAR